MNLTERFDKVMQAAERATQAYSSHRQAESDFNKADNAWREGNADPKKQEAHRFAKEWAERRKMEYEKAKLEHENTVWRCLAELTTETKGARP